MLNIKKLLTLLPIGLFVVPILSSCNNNGQDSKDGTIYLKVLNSEDYIYKKEEDDEPEDLIVQFEEYMLKEYGQKVKVVYDTFDTMENMYNTLKTGKTKYDVICASEYMIQKLASSDLIEPLDKSSISNYFNDKYTFDSSGCSPFIREKLQKMPVIAGTEASEGHRMDDYVVCYMWGTLGILYNPTYSKLNNIPESEVHNDMKDWDNLWNPKYKKTISIKDSMRDTYCIGLMHKYKQELLDAESNYELRNKIFNYGGEADTKAKEHINAIKDDLLKLRSNVFGFEVDSGKQDIIAGKIGFDTAWSGDAVYSMDQADEAREKKPGSAPILYYSIPEIGTNLWFDCWCMQKGANKDVAQKFLNFISDPDNAIQNMEYIGYTSPIAGEATFNYFNETYSEDEGEEYDVSYFFNEANVLQKGVHTFTIPESEMNRQIAAQFPPDSVQDKLMIMQDYGNNNDLILRMWEQVKHESLPNWAIALLSVEGALAVAGVTIIAVLKIKDKNRRKNRKKRCACNA